MVGPQNLKPRPASSFDMARETGVSFGISALVRKRLTFGCAVDEVPQQLGEARPFLHHVEIGARGGDRALDLGAVAHDAGILHQRGGLALAVARDDGRLEVVEGAAEILALAQDGDPGEPGLEAVEHELLVERAVVVFRHAPFGVVIGDIERVVLRPGAAMKAVGVEEGGFHSAAAFSPGQTNRAHSGLTSRRVAPPATSGVPAASASATRSSRSRRAPARRPTSRRCRPTSRPPSRPRRHPAQNPHTRPEPRGCARCRDARCATPPPGPHSSPWRSRRHAAGPCRSRAGRRRHS